MRSRQLGFIIPGAEYVVLGLGVALALTLAASGFALHVMDEKITAANAKVTELSSALGKEEQSRQHFEDAASACSNSVDGYQRMAAAAKKEAAAKTEQAHADTKAANVTVQTLLAQQRPAGMDECTNARRLVDEELTRRATARK